MQRLFWFVLPGIFCFTCLGGISGQQAGQSVRQHLMETEKLLDRGQFVAALQEAKTAQAKLKTPTVTPDTLAAEVQFWMGRCYMLLGRRLGRSHLDSALALVGDVQTTLRHTIEIYLSSNEQRLNDAMNFFSSGQGKNERMLAEAHLAAGRRYLSQNQSDPDTEALIHIQQAEQLLEKAGLQLSLGAAQCQGLKGFYLWKKEKSYDTAIAHFKKAVAIYQQKGDSNSNYLPAVYVNMGGCYNDAGDSRKSLGLYHFALENFMAQDKALAKLTGKAEAHPNLLSVYNNLGKSHGDLGEFTLAIQYLREAVKISPRGRYWNNLGNACMQKGEMQEAEKCFHAALDNFLKEKQLDSAEVARPYHNLGVILRGRGNIDSALIYEFTSLPFRKSEGFFTLDVARTYAGISECYASLKKHQTAIAYLDTVLWIQHHKMPSGQHPEIASAFLSKSRSLFQLGDYDRAFHLIDSALYAGGYNEGDFAEVLAPLEVLDALNQRGTFLQQMYQKRRGERYLAESEKTYQTAATAIRQFRNTLLENESKAIISDRFRAIFSGGIETALEMHRLHPKDEIHYQQAFALAEQSKSLTLLEGVRSSGAEKFAGIPDSLLERERLLTRDIADTEIRLRKYQEQGLSPNDARFREVKDTLFRQQREYETFQRDLLSGGHANYYNYKYGVTLASPDNIRSSMLKSGQCLVEYFAGDSDIFIFVVRPEGFYWERVPLNFPLEKWVDTLEHGLYGYYTATAPPRSLRIKCRNEYVRAATNLYSKIIAPIEKHIESRVVIIPDGALSYIPFEALLRKKPDSLDRYDLYDYFGVNRVVSYCYSATLLRELRGKKHTPPPATSVLAFAPFFTGDTSMFAGLDTPGGLKDNESDPLLHSGEEVYQIAKMLRGKAWYGTEATRQKFIDSCHTARILHLSTHGLADTLTGEFAFLNFASPRLGQKPEKLYVKDLYTLSLKADLVVLSACQTGTGRLQGGEGVISIARAFALAGAKSIVTTLWSVREDSTKRLMLLFYAYILDGLSYDQALARAKTGFVRKGGEEAHPFFWAGFTGIGF